MCIIYCIIHIFLYLCKMKLRIIIDANIPYIRGAFDKVAEVEYLTAKEITAEKAKTADALVIRTRTHCNADLLNESNVKFIATATIGIDHIDTEYCDAHQIIWTNAPGCNAESVAQWVGSALAVWANKYNYSLKDKTIGIVGHGHVGKRVEKLAKLLGMKVLLNDPPLAEKDPKKYVDLETIASKCDVITFHTPLTKKGEFATWHLADKAFFEMINTTTHPLIINAARGGIIDEAALLDYECDCAIDCWEGEPETNAKLREKALIATPHIAGYSADGKYNASEQAISAVSDFFGINAEKIEGLPQKITTSAINNTLKGELLDNYDITTESNALKLEPEKFEWFRSNYPIRRELNFNHNFSLCSKNL